MYPLTFNYYNAHAIVSEQQSIRISGSVQNGKTLETQGSFTSIVHI